MRVHTDTDGELHNEMSQLGVAISHLQKCSKHRLIV